MKFNFTKQQEKENKKLSEEREREVIPIAKEVMKIIADADLAMGKVNGKDNERYHDTAKKVLEFLLSENMKYHDASFLFQLILQPFDQIREIVVESLKRSFNKAEIKLFGKDFLDLRLEDIDQVIRGRIN